MRSAQPFATALVLTAVGVVYLFVGFDVQSQEIPRDEYLQYIPLKYPTIVRQTKANVEMDLFGAMENRAYQDTDPVDGIDDHRHKVLLDLAVRFAPYLVLNSTLIPMDFRLFMECEEGLPLYVDTWNVSRNPPKLVDCKKIKWQDLFRSTSEAGSQVANADNPDCRLLSLLKTFDPFTPGAAYRSGAVAPDGAEHQVMFFDFPGDGEETWKQEYEDSKALPQEDEDSKVLPQKYEKFAKVFVHPFVEWVELSGPGNWGYEFVLQYWFFYPYNDGYNNHEGDWEHINVFIKPLNKLHELLSKTDVRRILAGGRSSDTAPDRLVIQKVDYYFHHKVMTLDYTRPNVYQPQAEWERKIKNIKKKRVAEDWIWKQIWYRAYWDNKRKKINTHPIGFIGGDHKSFGQLLEHPGKSNAVSNGTYPFPGLYKNVGPAGAIEDISQTFDHREHFNAGDPKRAVPKKGYRRGSVVGFASRDRIKILPDGERVVDLVKADTQARRDWAWLVLPIRWGYPATESPLAGRIEHANFGNISVVGPSYNAGWNRSGDAPGFKMYSPHTFGYRVRFALQDNFVSNMGIGNLVLAPLKMAPPLDIGLRLASLFSRQPLVEEKPVFLDNEPVPQRFLSAEIPVVTRMSMSQEFGDLILNDQQVNAIGHRLTNALGQGNPMIGEQRPRVVEDTFMTQGGITFYFGEYLVSQNSLRYGHPTFSYDITLPSTEEDFRIRGDIEFWEYSGSFRVNMPTDRFITFLMSKFDFKFNVPTDRFITFLMGGYGRSWYRLENVSTNGELLPDPDGTWINRPTWPHPWIPISTLIPNTSHFGGGLELVIIPNFIPNFLPDFILKHIKRLLSGFDISVRGEGLWYRHSLGIDIEGGVRTSSGPLIKRVSKVSQRITRRVLNLTLTIGF